MSNPTDEMVPDLPGEIMLECTNRHVKVEVVDGSVAQGTLVRYDLQLGNIELCAVRCQMPDSSLEVHERFFIPGSRVRLVHLPLEVRGAPQLQWRRDPVVNALKRSFKDTRRASHVQTTAPRTPRPPRSQTHKKESTTTKQLRKLKRRRTAP